MLSDFVILSSPHQIFDLLFIIICFRKPELDLSCIEIIRKVSNIKHFLYCMFKDLSGHFDGTIINIGFIA